MKNKPTVIEKKYTCNQCHKQMEEFLYNNTSPYESDDISFTVCTKPKCPNYGLYQTPMEYLNENSKK